MSITWGDCGASSGGYFGAVFAYAGLLPLRDHRYGFRLYHAVAFFSDFRNQKRYCHRA
jgi:hypothetical protein